LSSLVLERWAREVAAADDSSGLSLWNLIPGEEMARDDDDVSFGPVVDNPAALRLVLHTSHRTRIAASPIRVRGNYRIDTEERDDGDGPKEPTDDDGKS